MNYTIKATTHKSWGRLIFTEDKAVVEKILRSSAYKRVVVENEHGEKIGERYRLDAAQRAEKPRRKWGWWLG